MISRLLRFIRRLRIRALEQDIDWARASSDAHIRGLEKQLSDLRAEQYRDIYAQDIARRMDLKKLV